MATGLVWHETYMWHQTGAYFGMPSIDSPIQPSHHPEDPETKRRFKNLLEVSGLSTSLSMIEPRHATDEELLRFHTPEHIQMVKSVSDAGGGNVGERLPTNIGPGGYDIASLAAGGVIAAVDAVLNDDVKNAYALVRPPGHHALADEAMGFCIFANAALAGMHALEARKLDRIAFVDWDVHHGNGTESAFWHDPRALTISIHQDNCFPLDSGAVGDTGFGDGDGYNINIPLPPGSGRGAYEAAFERVICPALRTYKPQLIIVPSGFDAGGQDPLGRMMVNSEIYRRLTGMLMDVAAECCGGRIVMSHEGGYSIYSVPYYGLAVMEQLSGIRTKVQDPYLPPMERQGYHELQDHQEAVIKSVEPLVSRCI